MHAFFVSFFPLLVDHNQCFGVNYIAFPGSCLQFEFTPLVIGLVLLSFQHRNFVAHNIVIYPQYPCPCFEFRSIQPKQLYLIFCGSRMDDQFMLRHQSLAVLRRLFSES